MEEETLQVLEWTIENFGRWNEDIYDDWIASPEFAFEYVSQMYLYPRGSSGQDRFVSVGFCPTRAVPPSGGNLSLVSGGSVLLCTRRTHTAGWNNRIYTGLTFEAVAAKIKKEGSGDRLTLRLCFVSGESGSVAVSTTLDVLNVSLTIGPKSVQSLESDDSKNIFIIRYSKKNVLDELLLKAVRKRETVEFVLELLTKSVNAISVESQWGVRRSDNTRVRNEGNEYLFRNCEPWTFSKSSMGELLQENITMILSLKIVNGDLIYKQLEASRVVTTVPKKNVSFFDQSSLRNSPTPDVDSVAALTEDLMCLYQDRKFSDFQFKCEDVTFPVHRAILSARSPVLDRLLSCDMKEAASGTVDIRDLDPSTLGLFLTYLYTGAVELQHDNAFNLYYAADKYQVPSLKKECSKFLCSNLSLSNVCDVLSLAHKPGDDDMKVAAQDFVLDNYNQVLTLKEWGSLVKAEPSLVAEILTGFAAESSFFGKISP